MFRGEMMAVDEVEAPVICGKDDEDLLDHCDVHVVDPERVTAVRGRLVSPSIAAQMATVFKVLADQSRCRLMAAIIEAGELCVCDLAATVTMTESNVSHHLRVLRANGLVRARRAGKMVFYSPDDAHIRLLLDITREHVEHGPEDLSGETAEAGRRRAAAERGR
jgi:DNA-binding transcriptional ArsR family regulator